MLLIQEQGNPYLARGIENFMSAILEKQLRNKRAEQLSEMVGFMPEGHPLKNLPADKMNDPLIQGILAQAIGNQMVNPFAYQTAQENLKGMVGQRKREEEKHPLAIQGEEQRQQVVEAQEGRAAAGEGREAEKYEYEKTLREPKQKAFEQALKIGEQQLKQAQINVKQAEADYKQSQSPEEKENRKTKLENAKIIRDINKETYKKMKKEGDIVPGTIPWYMQEENGGFTAEEAETLVRAKAFKDAGIDLVDDQDLEGLIDFYNKLLTMYNKTINADWEGNINFNPELEQDRKLIEGMIQQIRQKMGQAQPGAGSPQQQFNFGSDPNDPFNMRRLIPE